MSQKPATFRVVKDIQNKAYDKRFSTGFNAMPVILKGAFVLFYRPTYNKDYSAGSPAYAKIVCSQGVVRVPHESMLKFPISSDYMQWDEARTLKEVLAVQDFTSYGSMDLMQHMVDIGKISLSDVVESVQSLFKKWDAEG